MKWIVSFGDSKKTFYTHYHADQFARALRLNGTKYKIKQVGNPYNTVCFYGNQRAR